jgi:16S rRNA processing protein RimM
METLAVGIIRTSHGVHGYVKVMSLSGETDHLFELEQVSLRKNGREKVYRVEEVKSFKDGVLMKLEGVDTPEAGKALAGSELWVERDLAAPLTEGEYYISDMIGCSLVCGGSRCGEVVSVSETGVADLLEVKTGRGVRMIPFTSKFVGEVDLESGTIELLEPELLE